MTVALISERIPVKLTTSVEVVLIEAGVSTEKKSSILVNVSMEELPAETVVIT